jgi:hypothetical protein
LVTFTATTTRYVPTATARYVGRRWYSLPVYAEQKYSHAPTVAKPTTSERV